MTEDNAMKIATGMIAFSTFLGFLFAGLYYLYQVKDTNFIEIILIEYLSLE